MDTIETIDYRGYKIRVVYDPNPINPRKEWDNFGHIVAWHRTYSLGDEDTRWMKDYDDWLEWLKEQGEDNVIAMPIRMYEHGGITLNAADNVDPLSYRYGDRWDSGWVGFIYVTMDEIRKEWSGRMSAAILKKVKDLLRGEVRVQEAYINGDVYGYVLQDGQGEVVDSCYGYFGDDKEYMVEEVKGQVDWIINNTQEELAEVDGAKEVAYNVTHMALAVGIGA